MKLRSMFTAALTGMFLVASAWAGVGIAPVKTTPVDDAVARTGGQARARAGVTETLGPDELFVGAAKVSIAPDPGPNDTWEHDASTCTTAEDGDVAGTIPFAPDAKSPWPENPSCIYAGGFGVGPSQPLTAFDDEYGLWVRSVAFRRGDQTLVLTLLDGEGYFARYKYMCPPEKACGSLDIAEQLGAELGVDPSSFVFASTHSHAAPDFIGGWGGVPVWYMRQVADALRTSARDAVLGAVPATLRAGEVLAHPFNGDRRDLNWSAEDPSLNWVRAVARDNATIATVATYAAHPTSFGGSWNIANADWPGQFAKTVETRFGGMGVVFPAGLGNMSARDNDHGSMGAKLAALLPDSGQLVTSPVVSVKQEFWDQPITNVPLGSLGAAGLFDRPFGGPATVSAGKSGARPCVSASALSVRVAATAAKIGGIYVTAAPGEIFSNLSNTIEERAPITALAIAQANDALGYMPQSFEFDLATQQGLGFADPNIPGGNPWGYEEAYGLDRCFGDKVLATQLKLLG